MTASVALRLTILVVLLGAIAAAAQPPKSSDRDVYQKIGRRFVVMDCGDVHCFRPLVAVVLEHLPGPSLLKWKAYAVLMIAASAVAVARLCLLLGLSARAAGFATWIAAFGYGPLQSVFDPYTSDPLMYLLGPLLVADLLENRLVRAGLVGCVGVLAKEFAAAPLWIYALFAALQRRWDTAVRVSLSALTATLVWLTLQTTLMTLYNYRYGQNASVDLLGGGYLVAWARALGPRLTAAYLFMAFGPLYVLLLPGLLRAGRSVRLLALSCLPAAAAFVYVQQPDRALWNFHFIVIPIAVLVLVELPDWLCWLFVFSYGVANLRLGAPQPAIFPSIRLAMLAISMALAAMAIAAASGRHRPHGPNRAWA